MARKSKQTRNYYLKSILIGIPVVVIVTYILKTSYNIFVHGNSRSKEDENWWIFRGIYSVFSTEDAKTSKYLSPLGTQFYILLFNAVREDVFILLSVVEDIYLNCFNIFVILLQNLFITVISLCVIVISTYYLLFKRSHPKVKRKTMREHRVTKLHENHESVLGYSNQDGVLNVSQENRKYTKYLTGLIVVAFLLSIPWEFIRLYQSVVAEKVTRMTVGIPPECVPEQLSMTQSVKSWLRLIFSWSADPCLVYHKALLIDPLWHVSPLMVISSAFSHCIVYPVELLLGGLGRAFRAFFAEIPAQWQPLMLVVIVVFLLLTLVMIFGYRIHLPFILKFEPRTPVSQKPAPRTSAHLQKEKHQKSIEPAQENKRTDTPQK